jgi:hypothetical protein
MIRNCMSAVTFINSMSHSPVGQDSSVGIATGYRPDGPGMSSLSTAVEENCAFCCALPVETASDLV